VNGSADTALQVIADLLVAAGTFGIGMMLWFTGEYLLHRFAMHHLHGKGMMSREHLEHHVHSTWRFSYTHLLSWTGVVVVGAAIWLPVGWLVNGTATGILLAAGWAGGYAFYEFQHARSHLVPPRGRYGRWIRRHHLHHHFGRPMSNHGVSMPLWDHVFGTHEAPEQIRVPRRLALPWMLDDRGDLLDEFTDDYVLVGHDRLDERQAGIDRARAFASQAPTD
jgi:sterol desaturase/sphingolipid hydroxylase (fatty acid hydroxylase superfamily)